MRLLQCLILISTMLFSAMASAAAVPGMPDLPRWRVLEFEEKAFWATARARLELPDPAPDATLWEFNTDASLENSFEKTSMLFDPRSGQLRSGNRLTKASDQRLKSWDYRKSFIVRKRHNPEGKEHLPPQQWPLRSHKRVQYPASIGDTAVTNAYLLLVLAGQLAAQGPGQSLEVIVHTDFNFYRASLSSVRGTPIATNYKVRGSRANKSKPDTTAVRIVVTPVEPLAEKDDFSLLGLSGEMTLYFDKQTLLPLRLHGDAPHIGTTNIDLRAVTFRNQAS